nr:heterodimeric geranylgeranyl pyrophosphate synthase small subunit, chloroplastic-like [Ipomoea trifida]
MALNSCQLYIPARRPVLKRGGIRCSSASVSVSAASTNFDLKTYWATLIKEINQKLDEAIPVQYPNQIYEAMRYSVLAKGAKRAPPIMCVSACELFGGNRLAAFPTACALEMVHAASLIHDDLPCMDDDPFRRGKPTNHTKFGVDMAILAGDALFPLGFQHIVSHTPTDLVPENQLLQVITEIARAVGSTGMAAGQFVDLEGGPNAVGFVQEKKFGEMGECSAVCGGLLAGASDEEIEMLRRYGRAVGVLYQVVDDIREAKTESVEKNKKKGKSYVSVYGVEKAMEVAEELRGQAKKELDALEKYGDKVIPLHSFVDYAAYRGFNVDVEEVVAILKLSAHVANNFPGVFYHGKPSAVLPVIARILPFFAEPAFKAQHGVIFETVVSLLSLLRTGDRDAYRLFFMDAMLLVEDLVDVALVCEKQCYKGSRKVSLKCFTESFSGAWDEPSALCDLPQCCKADDSYGILINLTGNERCQLFASFAIKVLSKCLTEGTLYVEGLLNTSCILAICKLLCYGDADLHMVDNEVYVEA